MAVEQQPDVFIAGEASKIREGVYTQAGGEFDLTGEASLTQSHDPVSKGSPSTGGWTSLVQEQDTTNVSLGLRKKLRTGQTLSVGVVGDRSDLTLAGIQATGPDNTGQVRFTIVQPLGKGRGRVAADANEESAKRLSEASLETLRQVLSSKAADAVQAYWLSVSADRQLEILRQAEERSRILTEQIAALIAKEEVPAKEISQAQANLADARRARMSGEQALFEARQRLLLAMGISSRQLAAAVVCRDDFPAAPDRKALNSFDLETLFPAALKLRSDYRAQEKTESAYEVYLAGVRRNMAPQVDLKLQAGYTGYKSGSGVDKYVRSFQENVPGAGISMQIVAAWPFSNSEMRGRLMQAAATLEQARWEKEKLDRQIHSNLMTAWSQLRSRIEITEQARRSREYYEDSLTSEKKKYQLGMSTLINVVTVENQLTQAQLNVVLAQAQLAIALISLRFESGTLLSGEGETAGVRPGDLVTLPAEGMKTQKPTP